MRIHPATNHSQRSACSARNAHQNDNCLRGWVRRSTGRRTSSSQDPRKSWPSCSATLAICTGGGPAAARGRSTTLLRGSPEEGFKRLHFQAGHLLAGVPAATGPKDIPLLAADLQGFDDDTCERASRKLREPIDDSGARGTLLENVLPETSADLVDASLGTQRFVGSRPFGPAACSGSGAPQVARKRLALAFRLAHVATEHRISLR